MFGTPAHSYAGRHGKNCPAHQPSDPGPVHHASACPHRAHMRTLHREVPKVTCPELYQVVQLLPILGLDRHPTPDPHPGRTAMTATAHAPTVLENVLIGPPPREV